MTQLNQPSLDGTPPAVGKQNVNLHEEALTTEVVKREKVPDEDRPSRCEGCPYQLRRTCGSRGPRDARVVMVAESPGDLEERYGIPLIGPSGKLVESALPDDCPPILYLNAIQCYPGQSGQKDARILTGATFSCRDRLFSEILEHPRDLIIVLGKYAAISLTGNPKVAITQIRGQTSQILWDERPLAKNGVFFSVHPSYLLHGGGNADLFYGDISRAILEGTSLEEKQGKKQIKRCKVHKCDSYSEWISHFQDKKLMSADIETTGLDHTRDQILWLGGYSGGETCYVVSGEILAEYLLKDEEVGWPLELEVIWQNGGFDAKFLRMLDINIPLSHDTMLQSYTLNEQQGNHDLDSIGLHYLGLEPHKDMVSEYYKGGRTLADAPEELVLDYLGMDLRTTFLSYGKMKPLVDDDYCEGYYERSWNPNLVLYNRLLRAQPMLTSVEEAGIMVDEEILAVNSNKLEQNLKRLMERIQEGTGGVVENPGSTQQCQHYLFNVLGFPRIADSSDKATLERLVDLRGDHEFIELLLEYRHDSKLFGTYVNNVPEMLRNGRIHASFLLHGTITGRLASRKPNMQNIPRPPEDPEDVNIRSQFRAAPGKKLMGIDLNQAELRALACLSYDTALCSIYNDPNGVSLHDVVSTWMFGEDFTKEDKMKAKTVNFGIVYGRTGGDIARVFKLPKQTGQAWLDWWFTTFPEAHEFLKLCELAPMKEQTIISPFGNKKRPKIVTHQTKHNIQNQAKNFLPQNIGSNLILDAATEIWERYESRGSTAHHGWEIVNLIHDESLFEIVDDEKLQRDLFEEFSYTVQGIATTRGLTQVPFICEAKIDTHWGDLEETDWRV